jgi:hypothetical protein
MSEIKKKYKGKANEIDQKIKLLQEKLEKHKIDFEINSTNWGYIGDLSYINEKLDEVVSFLK